MHNDSNGTGVRFFAKYVSENGFNNICLEIGVCLT